MPTTRRRLPSAVVALLVALALVAGACSGSSDDQPGAAAPTTGPSVSITGLESTTTSTPSYRSQVAIPLAEGQLSVYAVPQDGATVTHQLPNPRLINDDPNAAVPLVLLVKENAGAWLEVYLPVRPNGSTGWVRTADVRLEEHDYRVEVELDAFTLRVFKADEEIFTAPIGVARENAPTPGGLYFTTELIRPVDAPSGPYGTYAYGLSGFSDTYQTFNGGPGQLGIHGTNQPEAIGTRVSSGCIRLNNDDIDVLAEEIGLPLGVPVIVRTAADPTPPPAP